MCKSSSFIICSNLRNSPHEYYKSLRHCTVSACAARGEESTTHQQHCSVSNYRQQLWSDSGLDVPKTAVLGFYLTTGHQNHLWRRLCENRRKEKWNLWLRLHFMEVGPNGRRSLTLYALTSCCHFRCYWEESCQKCRERTLNSEAGVGIWVKEHGPCFLCLLHECVSRMSLSSGGWTHSPGFTSDQSAALPGHYEAAQSRPGCQTVLMSVRVSVCHSGIRPLCLPGAGDESLRLQLSMDPGKSGEFRLSLQDSSGTGRSVVSSWESVMWGCCGVCFTGKNPTALNSVYRKTFYADVSGNVT